MVCDRDRNVKGKNIGCVKLISNLWQCRSGQSLSSTNWQKNNQSI